MSRPNIIFYFSDQQRWDTMGCYGQRLPVTPNLDRLAAEGTRFEYAFTCQPVCGPARACIQSGLYATQVNCHANHHILPEGMPDVLARRFNASGYQTAYVGKWHLASCKGSSYRTEAVPPERRGGYQDWMVADALEWTSHGYNGYLFDGEMKRHDFVGYRVDAINNYAIDFIHRHMEKQKAQGTDQPFFLFVSQLDPHHQNDRGIYEGPDGSKKKFADYDVPGDLVGAKGDWRENYPDYLGACNSLDQNVGRLMDTLEAYGIADNTIILYTCDHGSHFKTRNAEYKRACHDGCLRLPMIAWGGPFQGGHVVKDLVSLIDVPPTLLDCAGIPIPQQYQGRSMLGLVSGEAKDWPKSIYAQISEAQTARTVRTSRWKYCVKAPEFDIDAPYSDVYVEDFLYDLENDPHERRNLVIDPAYADIRAELKEVLIGYMKKAQEPEAVILPMKPEDFHE